MDVFFSKTTDTFYVIPHRNGSSLFDTRIYANKQFDLLDIPTLGQEENLAQSNMGVGYDNFTSMVWLLRYHKRFSESKIVTIYRDPLVKYKSGLKMVFNVGIPLELDDIDQSEKLVLTNIINRQGMTHMTFLPQYHMQDTHLVPTAFIQLMLYCTFPGRTKLINLRDYTSFLENEFPEADLSLKGDRIANKEIDTECDISKSLWNMLLKANANSQGDTSVWLNPPDELYGFIEWLKPDTDAYVYLESNNNGMLEAVGAQAFASNLIESSRYVLLRSLSVYMWSNALLQSMLPGRLRNVLTNKIALTPMEFNDYITKQYFRKP